MERPVPFDFPPERPVFPHKWKRPWFKISQASPAHARLGLGTVLKTLWDVSFFFKEHMASEIDRVLTSVLVSLAD